MGSIPSPSGAKRSVKRPNFLVIVADDLGYSDIAPFGGEINTPNLTRLASSGVCLTNFHTASACSPTRSMLLSGTDNHIAGLGQMTEHMAKTKEAAAAYAAQPGYEGYLNFRVAALSEVLQDAGYRTLMSGKWHLGLSKETAPCSRGFDESFVFLSGCCNHFNYEPQLDDPSHCLFTPMDASKFWMEGERHLDRKKDLPEDFYSTTSFTDRLLEYLDARKGKSERLAAKVNGNAHAANGLNGQTSQAQPQPNGSDPHDQPSDEDEEAPFFAYLAFTAPHWPLQAPRAAIDKYQGRYDDGPAALRTHRLNRLRKLGIIPADAEPAPMTTLSDHQTESGARAWEVMTPKERAKSARSMEVFAAMVDVIDENIGRVIAHLEETGELDNTFVLFMSDNGAEGALLEALPIMGEGKGLGGVRGVIDKYYDNSLESAGDGDSYIWYGPEWACASMAPSRGFKTYVTEGGIRCPCVVRYPPLHTEASGGSVDSVKPGGHSDAFTTVMDIMPTILDLAGVKEVQSPFRGREVVPMRGASWVEHMSGKKEVVHGEAVVTGWELFGLRAVRVGGWKALYMNAPRGKDRWELYRIEEDPGELRDLAEDMPEKLAEMVAHWETYYAETGMFDPGHEFDYTRYT